MRLLSEHVAAAFDSRWHRSMQCPDQPGVVAAIAQLLYGERCF
jgi:formyltetrahydrofolate hydrolase